MKTVIFALHNSKFEHTRIPLKQLQEKIVTHSIKHPSITCSYTQLIKILHKFSAADTQNAQNNHQHFYSLRTTGKKDKQQPP